MATATALVETTQLTLVETTQLAEEAADRATQPARKVVDQILRVDAELLEHAQGLFVIDLTRFGE